MTFIKNNLLFLISFVLFTIFCFSPIFTQSELYFYSVGSIYVLVTIGYFFQSKISFKIILLHGLLIILWLMPLIIASKNNEANGVAIVSMMLSVTALIFLYLYLLLFHYEEANKDNFTKRRKFSLYILAFQTLIIFIVVIWAITQRVEAKKQKYLVEYEQQKALELKDGSITRTQIENLEIQKKILEEKNQRL